MGKILLPGDSSIRFLSISLTRKSAPQKHFLQAGTYILSHGYLGLDTQFLTLRLWTILSTAHSYPPSADLLCIFEKFTTPFADQRRCMVEF